MKKSTHVRIVPLFFSIVAFSALLNMSCSSLMESEFEKGTPDPLQQIRTDANVTYDEFDGLLNVVYTYEYEPGQLLLLGFRRYDSGLFAGSIDYVLGIRVENIDGYLDPYIISVSMPAGIKNYERELYSLEQRIANYGGYTYYIDQVFLWITPKDFLKLINMETLRLKLYGRESSQIVTIDPK